MKKPVSLLVLLFAALFMPGVRTAAVAYDGITLDGKVFELENVYNFAHILPVPTSYELNQGFLRGMMILNGDVYIPHLLSKAPSQVTMSRYRISASGFECQEVEVVFSGDVPDPLPAQLFAGNDSQGNPFICSACGYEGVDELSFPMIVYKCAEGPDRQSVVATRVATLPMWDDYDSREVSIFGQVDSGTFDIAAIGWKDTDHTGWKVPGEYFLEADLGLWTVQDGEASGGTTIRCGVDDIFFPTIQALGNNYLLVDERGYSSGSKTLSMEQPTLFYISDRYKLGRTELSQTNAPLANGAHIFELSGHRFIIYPSLTSDKRLTYTIAFLPDYPASIEDSEPLWTLTEEFPQPDNSAIYKSFDGLLDTNFITYIPGEEGQGSLYIQTATQGLSKYTVTDRSKVMTSLRHIAAEEAQTEYYTLTGARATEPLAPGIYIQRLGSQCRVVYVR